MPSRLLGSLAEVPLAAGTIAARLAAASRSGAVGAGSAVFLLEARRGITRALRERGRARRRATWAGVLRTSWTRALRARAEGRLTKGWFGPAREARLPRSGWALAERLARRTDWTSTAEARSRVVASRRSVCSGASCGARSLPSPSLGAGLLAIKGLGAGLVVSRVVGLDRAYLQARARRAGTNEVSYRCATGCAIVPAIVSPTGSPIGSSIGFEIRTAIRSRGWAAIFARAIAATAIDVGSIGSTRRSFAAKSRFRGRRAAVEVRFCSGLRTVAPESRCGWRRPGAKCLLRSKAPTSARA